MNIDNVAAELTPGHQEPTPVTYLGIILSQVPQDMFDGIVSLTARTAHQVNAAYCRAIGDTSQPSWEDAPDWQKMSALEGIKFILNNPNATPEDSHKSWMAVKEAEGWVYGPEKNVELKQHPCLVPYDQLPIDQRAKDYLFQATVRSLTIETVFSMFYQPVESAEKAAE